MQFKAKVGEHLSMFLVLSLRRARTCDVWVELAGAQRRRRRTVASEFRPRGLPESRAVARERCELVFPPGTAHCSAMRSLASRGLRLSRSPTERPLKSTPSMMSASFLMRRICIDFAVQAPYMCNHHARLHPETVVFLLEVMTPRA